MITEQDKIASGLTFLMRRRLAILKFGGWYWTESGRKFLQSLPEDPDKLTPPEYVTKLLKMTGGL